MEFGLFIGGWVPDYLDGRNDAYEHQRLIDETRIAEAGDRSNWKYVWVTEHHFLAEYSHISANEIVMPHILDLPMATDVHWHGMNVENRMDGVAPITQDLIEPGESFTYELTADEQAVAMYHPHAHGHLLLPDGMFGAILVGQVRLPLGQTVGLEQVPADLTVAQEIPMVLNDAGAIGFSLNGKSFPATEPYVAKTGDWVLIHYFNEGVQIHPMHLHQFDQIVVAKDGYPLDSPYTVDTLNVAPGERYSVLVQLDQPGTWVWHCHILPHVEREAGMFGMVTALVVE